MAAAGAASSSALASPPARQTIRPSSTECRATLPRECSSIPKKTASSTYPGTVKASAISGWCTTSGRSTTPSRKVSAAAPMNGQAARGSAANRRGAVKQAQTVPMPIRAKAATFTAGARLSV
jgi:hypothetical protein